MKIVTLTLLLFTALNLQCRGQATSILFIGNSYTGSNNLPVLVEQLALSLGDSIIHDRVTPGGYTYEAHSTNAPTLAKIASENWDFVVLQEQSQRPSFPPAQVASDVYPYAEVLVDSIRSNNPCSEPIFFMTWGRENGDQSNCMSWPPVCTYAGMQARLRESYLEMAYTNSAWCAPVGVAWKNTRDSNPAIGLYTPDGSHPNINGSYLAACTFYATIFRKSPVGATFISSLSPTDALVLQQVAANTVLDSIETWNIEVNHPVANFGSMDLMTGTVQFNGSLSSNATTYDWDFGDGQSGVGSTVDHTYSAGGVYDVTLVVVDSCGRADTTIIPTNVAITGIDEYSPGVSLEFHSNAPGVVIVNSSETISELNIELFDASGRLVDRTLASVPSGITAVFTGLDRGTYLLLVRSDAGLRRSIQLFVN